MNQENYICLDCLHKLPRTDFHKTKGNKVEQMFWGRVHIEQASSFFYFRKGSRYQKLIHHLKYKGLKEIGEEIGKNYGFELNENIGFSTIDIVVPVPLHPKKLKKRGFNQSELIAKGIARAMNKTVNTTNLNRIVDTSTQTRKSRFQRWENVEGIFDVNRPELFANKHILLIDDVVTTGSTLEACCIALLKVKNVKVSIATLAYADL